jgi:TonB family protein
LIEAAAPLQFAIEEQDRSRWRTWVIVALLVLLCHVLLSFLHWNWQPALPPMPVDINPVDPQKLAQIREQWRRDKNILIDKDKNRPSAAEKPKDARYFSDKNIRVEKEQRARDTNVLPKPGAPGPQTKAQEQAKPKKAKPQVKPAPDLSKLGVPLRLDQKPKPVTPDPPEKVTEPRARSGNDAGDQAVLDRTLPQGSENLLNAEESVFYSFYSRMYEAIAPIWQSRVREVTPTTRILPGDYTTVVDVVLDREGNLIAVRQIQSSGVAVLDQAVENSWHKTGHFPNPPKELLNKQGEVHTGWTFTVQLSQGSGLQYVPPERVY